MNNVKTNKVINAETPIGVAPIGVAMYPKLTEPDYKFNLTEEEAEPIITEIKEIKTENE